jgi:hypothetical protein
MIATFVLFCLGLFYGNFLEYVIHRYAFHKMGRKKGSWFRYHLKGHHVLSKKQGFVDLTQSNVESVGLVLLMLVHLPLYFFLFPVWLGVTLYAIAFNLLHG